MVLRWPRIIWIVSLTLIRKPGRGCGQGLPKQEIYAERETRYCTCCGLWAEFGLLEWFKQLLTDPWHLFSVSPSARQQIHLSQDLKVHASTSTTKWRTALCQECMHVSTHLVDGMLVLWYHQNDTFHTTGNTYTWRDILPAMWRDRMDERVLWMDERVLQGYNSNSVFIG